MRGRSNGTRGSRIPRTLGAVIAAAGVITASLLITSPAGAATDNAQLGPTGPSDKNSPSGGTAVQVKPGDTVSFATNLAPTSILETLHLDSLASTLNGLLAGLASPGVTADFSKLPGGKADTKLSGTQTASFRFTKLGTYAFTYTFDSVILGGHTPLYLDGNQLKKAGVELNAKNQYVGEVVVSNAKPTLTISGQLPKTSVQPKVGGISLPKVSIPGVNLPTVRVPVPDLNPTKGSGSTSKPSSGSTGSSSSGGGSDAIQQLPVPARVLGAGATGGGSLAGGGSGGYYASNGGGISPLGNGQSLTLGGSGSSGSGSSGSDGTAGNGATKNADQLASNDPPSAQLPVVLAIIAIIALSLVASTYARLFLLRRPSSSS